MGDLQMSSFHLLISVLDEIYQSQLEIVELATQKREVLVKGEISELTKIIQLESNWIKRISKLEDKRVEILHDVLKGYKISDESITITEIKNFIESPKEKAQLEDIYEKLQGTIDEIQQLNDLNTQLIEQSLDFISTSLETVTGQSNQPYTYSKPSNKVHNSMPVNRGYFDKKA
jgi:flagellar biosynthesis/type III secretory pathway chaperone